MIPVNVPVPSKYHSGRMGILLLNTAENKYGNDSLKIEKEALLQELRLRYSKETKRDLMKSDIIKDYVEYYKQFGKSYHVLMQLESIVHKNKDIPAISPLVQAMFMAEMKNFFLTAGHDYRKITEPLTVSMAKGDEKYTLISGQEKLLSRDDLFMTDKDGVISSIIYGPDSRTKITPDTRKALYCVYVPFKTTEESIINHLKDIARYAGLNDRNLDVEEMRIIELQ